MVIRDAFLAAFTVVAIGVLRITGSLLVASGAVVALGSSARADVTLPDSYVGGLDHGYGDVIQNPGTHDFEISSAVIRRIAGGSTLQVVINTNFAGKAGLDGVGYGSLFISPGVGAWNPSGTSADGYLADNYSAHSANPNYWAYAFTTSGVLYKTIDGAIVTSNVNGGHSSNTGLASGFIFRDNQPVDFIPTGKAQAFGTFTPAAGTLTFDIVDGGTLGNDFAISWAMTCANDIIQGQVVLSAVPEPSTWAMMLIGFAGIGFMVYRRSRKALALA